MPNKVITINTVDAKNLECLTLWFDGGVLCYQPYDQPIPTVRRINLSQVNVICLTTQDRKES